MTPPPKTLGQISQELSGPIDTSYNQENNNQPKTLGAIASNLSGFTGESEPITSKQEARYTPSEEEAFKIHNVDTRPQAGDPFEQLGQNQSTLDKVGNGIIRLVGTTATKLGSGIGYIGGFGAWAAGGFDDISKMTDNAWSETFNNWEQSLKSNVPIYTPTSVKEGGLWKHITSTSFWADQGVDGAAYMLSALVPGLAISKLAKAGALVAGLAEGAEATAAASKVATYGNTILSTISEAAQEAKGVQDSIRESYKKKLLNGEITNDEVELKAAEAAKNDFIWNAGILMVPNFIENRFFLGKLGSETKLAEKIVDTTTGDLIDNSSELINDFTKKNLATNIIKNIGIGVASEGFWEENVQLSIQNYYQNLAEGKIKKEDQGAVLNIAKGLYDNLFTEEGKESIFLGAFMGGIGGGIGAIRETKEEKAILSNIQSDFKDNIGVRKDILKDALKNKYLKNEDGSIKLDESGKPIRNITKVKEAIAALTQSKRLEDLKRASKLAGDENLVDVIDDAEFAAFTTSLLKYDNDIDLVHKQIDTLVDKSMEEFTDPKDKVKLAEIKQEYKQRANKIAEISEVVSKNIKSWSLVGGKKATDKELSDMSIFLGRHKVNTIIEASRSELLKKKLLSKKQEQYLLLNKELLGKIGDEGFIDTRTELDKQKSEQLEKEIKELTGALKTSNERYTQLSNKELTQHLFDAYLDKVKEDEDTQKEVDDAVNKAKEEEEKRKAKLAEEQRIAKEKKDKLDLLDSQIEALKFKRDPESVSKYKSLLEERKTIDNPDYLKNKQKNEDHLAHHNLKEGSSVYYNGSEYTIESIDTGENKAVIKKNKTKVILKITDLKPFKELNKDDLQSSVSDFIEDPESNIDNQVTAENQIPQTMNERTDPIIPNVGGKTIAKKSNVLMYRLFEHIFSTIIKNGEKFKVFSWRRDEEGLPIKDNTTSVNSDLLNSPTELTPGTEVEFKIVELDKVSKEANDLAIQDSIDNIRKHISEGNQFGYSEEDNYGFGNGESIGIYKDNELLGFYQLPQAIPNDGDFFDYKETRENIIKERNSIISQIKQGKQVKTIITEKGNGNLYNKLTSEGKIDVYKNNDPNSYINVFTDDVVREQDKINGKPVFVVSNGDYLILPDLGLTGTKRENAQIEEELKNSINKFPGWGKKGQPFMLVKTANNTWYPAPIYSTPINGTVADKIVDKLKENQHTKEINTIVQALQPFVYVKISKSGAVKIFENENGELVLKVATKEFKVANMNYEDFKDTLIKNKIKQNINLKDINLDSGQSRMQENGTLTTNIKQFNGQYLIQPYIELKPTIESSKEKTVKLVEDTEEEKIETPEGETSLDDLVRQAKIRLEEKGFKVEDEEDYKTPKQSDIKSNKINIEKEFKHLEKILPGLTKKQVSFIKNLKGDLQWGSYKEGIIKVMSLSPEGTAYHEAFHSIVDMLSNREKEELFNEAEKKYKFSDKKLLEEVLADEFAEYTTELTKEKSLLKQGFDAIVNFFKNILEFFNLYNKHGESKLDKLFNEINKGKFIKESYLVGDNYYLMNNGENVEERYSVIRGISAATKLEYIETIGNEFLKQYFDLRNKGFSTKDISVEDIYKKIKRFYIDKYLDMSKMDNPDMKQVGLLNVIISKFDEFRENTNKYLKSAGLKVGDKIEDKINTLATEEGYLDDEQTDPENLDTHELGSEREKTFRDTNEIPGLAHASTRLKLFLAGIPQIDINTGNPKVNDFGQPLYVNMHTMYYFLERNLVGVYNFNDQIEELKFLTPYKPELKNITDKLEKGWEGISKEELLNIQNDFKTNFSKQQMVYLMVTFSSDPKTGAITYKVFESNRRTLRAEIEENWKNNLIIPSNDTVVEFKNGEVVKRTGTKKAIKLKDSWTKINNSLKNPNNKLSKFDLTVILNKLGIQLSEPSLKKLSESKDTIVINAITNLVDYFNQEEVNKKDDKKYTDAIKTIAELELKSNPTKYSSSFVNGEMKNIYTIQLPSYASKLLTRLGNTNKSVFTELIEELRQDPSYQHINLLDELLENEEFRKKGFKMFFLDSLKDADSKSEGSKFTKMSDKDYFASQLALFQNLDGSSKTILKKKTAKYTYLTPADKQELMIFDAPVYESIINSDGKVDSKSQILAKFYNVVLSEAARIKQQLDIKKKVESGELDKSVLLKNYHFNGEDSTKFDGRAFKFQIFESLNGDIYNSIVENIDNLDSIKQDILDTITNELNSNLKDAYKEALNKEIIGLSEDNTFINKSIDINSKEFTTKESVDHQIKQVIGNFFLNSYLFNVEMSKLLNGDPAIYKDLFKRTYQSGSKTKFGNMDKSVINTILVKDYTNRSTLLNNENFLKSISTLSEEDQEYIKKELAKTNVTDAQSWISPSFWKSILIASAEWTPDHQELYDLLESNKEITEFPERLRGLIKAVKPFYYGHRFNKDLGIIQHEQVKTSMMPLFRNLIKDSPLLMEHRNKMDKQGVDIVAFESTFKAAMPYRESVRDPEYKDNHIVQLDPNNFGIQVDNPDHSFESENSSMRQLKMQLPGNIPQDLKFEDGRTGREVRDEILSLEASIVSDASANLLKDVLNNEEKFNKLMLEALTSRNSTENIEKLLEILPNGKFKNNIALGPFIKDIEYLISSIWTKKVIKQSFDGGNLVQATSFGFRFSNLKDQQIEVDKDKDLKDIQSRLKHVIPTNGKTEFAEAVMPAWSKDFFDSKGFIKDLNEIPEELREMIIYRIPTEGYHSMLPIKVVSFLPESYGNFMLLPYEITTQFGADFDFDKVFFAVSSHKVNKETGKIEKVKFDETKSLSENTKEQRNNRILDLYKEVLRHPDIYKYMIKPSGFKKQEEIKAKLKSQVNTIKKERGESTEDPNYYSPIQQRNLKTRNHINIALKGQAANDVSGHAYTVVLDLKVSDINKVIFDNITQNDLSRVINDNGDMIGDELGSNLAAVLDDLKNPILAYLNINNTTINLLNTIIRLGFNIETGVDFITQPSIVNLAIDLDKNKRQQKDSNQGFYSLDSLTSDYLNKTSILEKIVGEDSVKELKSKTLEKEGNPNNISTKDLTKWRKYALQLGDKVNILTKENLDENPELLEFYYFQNKVLEQYKKVSDIKDFLTKLNRLFGVNSGAGPGYEDILDKEVLLDEIKQSKVVENFNIEKNQALDAYYKANEDALQVFKKYLPYDNSMFRGLKTELATRQSKNLRTINIKTETRDKFNRFVNGALLHQFFNTKIEDIERLFVELPAMINELKKSEDKKIKNNPLIQELNIAPSFQRSTDYNTGQTNFSPEGRENYITLRSNTYMPFIKDSISDGWLTLFNNPQTKEIATDLVKYSLFATNFYTGLRSFHNLIPIEILQNLGINEFMDDNKIRLDNNIKILTEEQQNRLLDQFIRNNVKLSGLVKIVNEEIFNFDGNYASTNEIRIAAKAQKDNMILLSEDDGEGNTNVYFTQYIRIKNPQTNKRELYRYKGNRKDIIIYERISTLGKSGYLIELDLNNDLELSRIESNNRGIKEDVDTTNDNIDTEYTDYEEIPNDNYRREDEYNQESDNNLLGDTQKLIPNPESDTFVVSWEEYKKSLKDNNITSNLTEEEFNKLTPEEQKTVIWQAKNCF